MLIIPKSFQKVSPTRKSEEEEEEEEAQKNSRKENYSWKMITNKSEQESWNYVKESTNKKKESCEGCWTLPRQLGRSAKESSEPTVKQFLIISNESQNLSNQTLEESSNDSSKESSSKNPTKRIRMSANIRSNPQRIGLQYGTGLGVLQLLGWGWGRRRRRGGRRRVEFRLGFFGETAHGERQLLLQLGRVARCRRRGGRPRRRRAAADALLVLRLLLDVVNRSIIQHRVLIFLALLCDFCFDSLQSSASHHQTIIKQRSATSLHQSNGSINGDRLTGSSNNYVTQRIIAFLSNTWVFDSDGDKSTSDAKPNCVSYEWGSDDVTSGDNSIVAPINHSPASK